MTDELRPEQYEQRREILDGWPIGVVSYKLGDRFLCKIDNVDPGALIARGEGTTREEAEKQARDRAAAKLATTQRMKDSIRVLREQVAQLDERLRRKGEGEG